MLTKQQYLKMNKKSLEKEKEILIDRIKKDVELISKGYSLCELEKVAEVIQNNIREIHTIDRILQVYKIIL